MVKGLRWNRVGEGAAKSTRHSYVNSKLIFEARDLLKDEFKFGILDIKWGGERRKRRG